jgi:F1F0 ATPase subunit 2
MMNEIQIAMLAGLAGLFLGVVFFGGLWWTVQKCVSSQRPVLWILPSLVLRMSITLAGFYFVSDGHWQRLILCLLGFLMARLIVTRLSRLSVSEQTCRARRTSHAP